MREPLGVRLLPHIESALRDGSPIVALESSVLAQGLPIPANRDAARQMLAAVERAGALPAIAAIARGVPTFGLDDIELARFLARNGVRKVSARDMPWAIVQRADGATTVAATLALCTAVGITVFATGGIGGVHRENAFDESADLLELARSPVIVVCSGAKSILDLAATLERLETLGVPVIGYRTSEFPAFFTTTSGIPLTARAETSDAVTAAFRAHRMLGRMTAMLVVQPVPEARALPRARVEEAIASAVASARENGIRGAALTPYLLAAVERATDGASLAANLALLEANASLAGKIAASLARRDGPSVTARGVRAS